MNLAEYRRTATRLADFLPWAALVGEGRRAQQGRQLPAHGEVSRADLDSAVAAELVAVAGRSTTPSAVSAPAGRSSSRRSAMRPRPIPAAISRSGLGAGRCRAQGRFEEAARISCQATS
jgi:hypothetical protein